MDMRSKGEMTVRALAGVGLFRAADAVEGLTSGEVRQVMAETCGHDGIETEGGWTVVLSQSTLAAVALRRIAGALGDDPSLARVPRHEVEQALARAVDHSVPEMKSHFEALPDASALDALFYLVGCAADASWVDFSTVPDWIAPEGREADALRALKSSVDCNLQTATLIRAIGMSGQRTTFNDVVMPSVPFLAGGGMEPVRLLGRRPSEARLKQREGSTFLGVETSGCGNRVLVEYRLTEEMVETASFHVSRSARHLVAGVFRESRSGVDVRFNIETKHARKFAGLRTVVRKLYPDYVQGQRAYVLLDRSEGSAHVEVLDASDHDGRDRIRGMLDAERVSVVAALQALDFPKAA